MKRFVKGLGVERRCRLRSSCRPKVADIGSPGLMLSSASSASVEDAGFGETVAAPIAASFLGAVTH